MILLYQLKKLDSLWYILRPINNFFHCHLLFYKNSFFRFDNGEVPTVMETWYHKFCGKLVLNLLIYQSFQRVDAERTRFQILGPIYLGLPSKVSDTNTLVDS